jgi:hypothetical protein
MTFAIVQHPLYIQGWTNNLGTNNGKVQGLKIELMCKIDRNCGALPLKYSNFCATIIST